MTELVDKLVRDHRLTTKEYEALLRARTPELAEQLARLADRARRRHYGTKVFLRGLVSVSSICKHNCLLCPQRSGAEDCARYRLRPREILDCCEEGYGLDIRTFVLQGGPDDFYSDEILCGMIEKLKLRFPDCAVTLAMGERSRHSCERLFNAGADRYVLLHETADPERYGAAHPAELSCGRRLHCLNDLKEIGYQTGCGFPLGVPGETAADLARELKFIEEFQPHSVDLVPLGDGAPTAFLLSILRLMLPNGLLTAPADLESGVLAGANAVVLGLSRSADAFALCGGRRSWDLATVQSVAALRRRLAEIGFEADPDRGDWNG